MNKDEAQRLLATEMREYRSSSYAALVDKIERDVDARQVRGPTDVEYAIEIQAYWDRRPNGDVRVAGAIDDGGLFAAMAPLCGDFIMTPDGQLVGE